MIYCIHWKFCQKIPKLIKRYFKKSFLKNFQSNWSQLIFSYKLDFVLFKFLRNWFDDILYQNDWAFKLTFYSFLDDERTTLKLNIWRPEHRPGSANIELQIVCKLYATSASANIKPPQISANFMLMMES